jgi:RES domain-containing protein
MPITAWRIVKARRAGSAFDGEGARMAGGRWNSPGMSVVYTSSSAALAALEMLVHLGRGAILGAYALIPCAFDEILVARLNRRQLPPNWRSYPATPELQALGDDWIRSRRSAVLEVPSVVIENEPNYLLNPNHQDFKAIRIKRPLPFRFDLRLLKI